MHEMSIALSLQDSVLQELERAGASKVSKIEVTAGELSGVVPEALQFAFDELAKGHPALEGVTLHVQREALRIHCHLCETKADLDDIILICPTCGEQDLDVIAGKEIRLSQMEVAID